MKKIYDFFSDETVQAITLLIASVLISGSVSVLLSTITTIQ